MRGLSSAPFGHAYDQTISFPPVMVDLWGVIAWIEGGLKAAGAETDVVVRVLMKLPAVAADVLLAGTIAWYLRATPRWAVAGAALVLPHPAAIDVSAWWGQYESVYVLFAAIAFVLAVRGQSLWAAVALALALMTKPQALPLAVPFAAWFLARGGWLASVRPAIAGSVVVVALWLPFLAAGGVAHYLMNVAGYQSGIYAILSLR